MFRLKCYNSQPANRCPRVEFQQTAKSICAKEMKIPDEMNLMGCMNLTDTNPRSDEIESKMKKEEMKIKEDIDVCKAAFGSCKERLKSIPQTSQP